MLRLINCIDPLANDNLEAKSPIPFPRRPIATKVLMVHELRRSPFPAAQVESKSESLRQIATTTAAMHNRDESFHWDD
jgi:hypothetical protein